MRTPSFSLTAARTVLATASILTCIAAQAATITIESRDPAGFGFNDPTPVAPVGGNMGTTGSVAFQFKNVGQIIFAHVI